MTAEANLRRHWEVGVCIQTEFIRATPETAAAIVERSKVWMDDLIPLVEAFGEGVAAPFRPLGSMCLEEQATVAHCPSLGRYSDLIRVCHAVCIYRLGKLFQKFDPVPPKPAEAKRPRRKPGVRPYHSPQVVQAVQDKIYQNARQGWDSNVQGTIKEVLDTLNLDADEYERAFERLQKTNRR